MSHRRHHLGAGGDPVGHLSLEPDAARSWRSADRRSSTRCSAASRRSPGPTSSRWRIVVGGLVCAVVALDPRAAVRRRPGQGAAHRRGRRARLTTIDFHFDPRQTYTFWSGLIGGLFLHLSYFGCDQSQVQRYLTAKSLQRGATLAADERVRQDPAAGAGAARRRVHVPVLRRSISRRCSSTRRMRRRSRKSARADEYRQLEAEFSRAFDARRQAALAMAEASTSEGERARARFRDATSEVQKIRARAAEIVADVTARARLQGFGRRHAKAGRQLRVSDLRHDAAAAGARRV